MDCLKRSRHSATYRRNLANGTRCTNGLADGRRKCLAKVFAKLGKDADFEETFIDSTVIKAQQHAAGAQKNGRTSTWPLAWRTDHRDSCAVEADGAMDILTASHARLPASGSFARRTASRRICRGQGLRCRPLDCAHPGDGRCRHYPAARQPAQPTFLQQHQYKHRKTNTRWVGKSQ